MTNPLLRPTAWFVILHAGTAVAQVPSPADVFGFRPGTDYRLADYEMVVDYFETLARRSDRVVLEHIGESSLGKPLLLAVISSADNITQRERYRDISRRLATVSGVTEAEARRLAAEGRAIVWVDGGLHATEVAHGQFTPEFAYWLATSEDEEARRVRDQTIVLVMPNMNPDGLDIVVNWYRRNVGTPFETAPVPELYHHYIGHDNNRDWYMFTQSETKAVADQLYHVWYPQIVYNHHQSGPFPARIWVPPFENPVNPNLDPLVVTSINEIGETMKKRFALEGKAGVISGVLYDMWWNGSMRGAPDFHNMLGFLTETALYRYATPHCYAEEDIPESFNERAGSLPARRPTTNYVDPWRGGCWHLRDPIEYMMTGTRAVVDLAARHRDEYLYNIYVAGRRQIERGRRSEGGPFAYVVPPSRSWDPGAAVELLRVFRQGGVEIRRADRPFQAGGEEFAAGAYVIPPQAFRPFVVDLMEPKMYPDRRQYPGGPPEPPYDMTGYELRLQMGVAAWPIREPFPLPEQVVTDISVAEGGVEGTGRWGVVVGRERNAAARLINRVVAAGGDVQVVEGSPVGRADVPVGAWVVRGIDLGRLDRWGRKLGVPLTALGGAPPVPLRPAGAPRIGLYESYVANMPGGWTRWLLEQYEFAFETLRDEDIRTGDLSTHDVIVLPSQTARSIVAGHEPGSMPEQYVGGIGREGVRRLQAFVRDGGWLVTVDRSVDFAIDQFNLPIRNVTTGLSSSDFFIPGSLINIRLEPDPLTRGLAPDGVAFFVRSQALETVGTDSRLTVLARYADEDYLASGWAHGADQYLAGKVAAVRVAVGDGTVVLFAFDPNFRGQPHGTFKLLFNTLFASAVRR